MKFLSVILLACSIGLSICQPALAQQQVAIARADFIRQMDGDFRKRDVDGDGRITRNELVKYEFDQAKAAAVARNVEQFARLDKDKNGVLSKTEFSGMIAAVSEPDVSEQLRKFDSSRDQVISLVEYRAATLASFDKMDADLDGVVTPAEMQAKSSAPPPVIGR